MKLLRFFLPCVFSAALTACGGSAEKQPLLNEKILIQAGSETATAVLYDNAAVRSLLPQLPLELTLEDFNGTEKIANPPEKLETKGVPDSFTPAAGDLAYYIPWGNLALFYRDFRRSSSLIHLGRIEGDGVRIFRKSGAVKVVIRREKAK